MIKIILYRYILNDLLQGIKIRHVVSEFGQKDRNRTTEKGRKASNIVLIALISRYGT